MEELYAIRSEHPFGDFFEEGMLDQIQQGLGEKVAARAISIPWFAEREVITDGGCGGGNFTGGQWCVDCDGSIDIEALDLLFCDQGASGESESSRVAGREFPSLCSGWLDPQVIACCRSNFA